MAFRVIDACGNQVKSGDVVYDFRGDHAVFLHVSRGPNELLGTVAKVMVSRVGKRHEFFARTFDLRVEVLAGVEV